MIVLIILLLIIVPLVYFVTVYNSLQTLKTQIKASIQEIGNQLKRQASLIPNLQEAVKGYLKHEKGVFEMLTDARKQVAHAQDSQKPQDIDKAIESIQSVVPKLNVMVENNPELKANTSVNNFMRELTDTADKLSYARRSLIDLTQSYNQKLVTFPSNIVANMFGFQPEKGLVTPQSGAHVEVSQEETKDVNVKL